MEFEVANDITPPAVALTSPVNGAVVSGTIPLQANASDNVGVLGVHFKVYGSNIGAEDQTAPYQASLDTKTLSNGRHTVTTAFQAVSFSA